METSGARIAPPARAAAPADVRGGQGAMSAAADVRGGQGSMSAPADVRGAQAARPGPADGRNPQQAGSGAADVRGAQRPAPAPPQAAESRLPLAGKPNAAAVEAWTGPEGEPLEPLSEEEAVARRWEAFLDDIKKRYGLDLYVTITNCRATSITPEFVDIAPINASFTQKLRNPTVLNRVTEVARAHFGEKAQVRIVDGSAASEGVTLQGIHDERTAKKKQTALSDPFVDKAVGEMGGRVTKVSVLEE
jgi:hypothetical protein